ncbi:class I SAM-dependent methyltransferase [Streptomyces synnematoformans]|uniref:Class I SAM-dependent methyltransferase n=1 Tax=Streptomyces synnematoformans TaxID=415721 RepID=A0ABP5KAW1_9ACTN
MTRHRIDLGPVQETLLIPLYGRAVENGRAEPALRDPRAEEIVASLAYDFARFDGLASLTGTVLRTALFDRWVREFLAAHPDGTVVEIGTGLNTRFERVDNGTARWLEFDLPDVIELRRTLFADTGRRRMLAASVTDGSWADEAVALGGAGPYFLAAEAVLPFLPEAEVRRVVDLAGARFPGALLALDTAGPGIVGTQESHDALSKVEARMRWACADPAEVAGWRPGARVLDSHTLTSLPEPMRRALPAEYREMLAGLAEQGLPQVEEYRLNLLRLPGRSL